MHNLWDVQRQQRKTTCLLSIRITFACARVSILTTTNMYIARARCESQLAVGSSGLNARWPYGRADEFKFLAWSSIAQSVCQWALRLLAIWCLRPWVRILHSAEEDNVSPFDTNIVCLCQSIDSNKYNKTKLNKTICIFNGMYYVCSNGSIKSQRSLLLIWSPFYASPITKLFMILVSRARRPATITWVIILESYHLVTSLQVVWN